MPYRTGDHKFIIYGLRDPITSEIRYVGKSTVGLRRPFSHMTPAQLRAETHRTHWIRSLLKRNLRFEVVILEHFETAENLSAAEQKWIAIGRLALGKRFTNATDGGDGSLGRTHSESVREALRKAATGRKHTPEARARMSASRKGVKKSAEHSAKIGLAQKGKKRKAHTEESRAKLSAASRGRPKPKEHAEKLAKKLIALNKSRTGKSLTEEHRRKISAGLFRYNENEKVIK